jgi:hypothetical protein
MDCFVASLLAMTSLKFRHAPAISQRKPPEFCYETPALQKSEGAGNAGRQMRPQPRV